MIVTRLGLGTVLATGALLAAGACPALASYTEVVRQTPGMDNYWRLGETSGSVVVDEIDPRDRDGRYGSQVGLSRPGAIPGDADTAIELKGAVPDGIWGSSIEGLGVMQRNVPFDAGEGPFSFEAWVKPDRLDGTTRRIFSGEGPRGGFLVGARSSGLAFSRYQKAATVEFYNTKEQRHEWRSYEAQNDTLIVPIVSGEWIHVVATYDADTPGYRGPAEEVMRLYVNGRLAAERPSVVVTYDFNPLRIGSMPGGWREWDGLIDEAARYHWALPASFVAEHYAAR